MKIKILHAAANTRRSQINKQINIFLKNKTSVTGDWHRFTGAKLGQMKVNTFSF